jgi:dihydroorotate dehydrogenase electron transfer subunit
MIQQTATLLWNRAVGPDCYRMGLDCPQGYDTAVPGQFVMVQAGPSLAPLLRRPFSIFARIGPPDHPEGIELLYKALGQGTRQMAHMAPGDRVDLLGPLGRGFTLDANARRIYLAAGGMGVAPIHFLAAQLRTLGVPASSIHLFLGGRNQADLLCREAFAALGIAVTVSTDDGSDGDQCLITDPLEAAIRTHPPERLYACGPHGMLQCVAGIATRHGIAGELSMETMMACGMGACLGCAVPDTDPSAGYRHVCIDGPVFDVRAIEW